MTYSDICKARCEWCAKGMFRVNRGAHAALHVGIMRHPEGDNTDCEECAAPSPERAIVDLSTELSDLRSRIQTAEKERDEAISARKHTQDWYVSRWQRMGEWFRSPEMKDTKAARDWFGIVANGELMDDSPPVTFMASVNQSRFMIERLTAECDAARERAKFASETLFFANLSPEDYAKFESSPFGYSGATGAGAKPEDYSGIGPYIATYLNELQVGMNTFGWEAVHLENKSGQWIARNAKQVSELTEDRDAAVKRACQLEGKLVAAIVQQHQRCTATAGNEFCGGTLRSSNRISLATRKPKPRACGCIIFRR